MPSSEEQPRCTRLGLALIITPLLWLAAEAVSPPLRSSSAAQLAVVAAHPDRWYWYTVLLIAGTITLVPAAIGLAHLTRPNAPRLASTGATLISFSAIVAVGDAMTQLLTWQMIKPGADRAQMAALLDRYDNSTAASIFFLPGGLALLAGTALLVAALLRTHTTPRWVAISLGTGLVINLAGFMAADIPIISAGAALMTPASLLLGRQLTGRPTPQLTMAPATASATS
jgi:Domain of unknown function (DUF4386)